MGVILVFMLQDPVSYLIVAVIAWENLVHRSCYMNTVLAWRFNSLALAGTVAHVRRANKIIAS